MNPINDIEKQFGNHLLAFIKSRVPSTFDAEDLYQEVILTIITKLSTLENPTRIKSWIFTIAKNKVTDYYRLRQKTHNEENERDMHGLPLVAKQDDPYEKIGNCVIPLIEQLPKDYRQLIYLSEIEEVPQKELAASLGINYVTVRSKIQRGRKKLRDILYHNCSIQKSHLGEFSDCQPKNDGDCCGNSCS